MYSNDIFHSAFSVVKGVLIALGFSLFGAVVFACVLRASGLSSGVIYPVNQCIKGLAIVVGVLSSVRGEKGWRKGGSVGLLFSMLSYLTFSALGGEFSLSWLAGIELLVGVAVGMLAGSVAVNAKFAKNR